MLHLIKPSVWSSKPVHNSSRYDLPKKTHFSHRLSNLIMDLPFVWTEHHPLQHRSFVHQPLSSYMIISIWNIQHTQKKETIHFNTRDFINLIRSTIDVINLMTSKRLEGHMHAYERERRRCEQHPSSPTTTCAITNRFRLSTIYQRQAKDDDEEEKLHRMPYSNMRYSLTSFII